VGGCLKPSDLTPECVAELRKCLLIDRNSCSLHAREHFNQGQFNFTIESLTSDRP
jgi:hypothetical protein